MAATTDAEIIRWSRRLEKVFCEAPEGVWFYVANGTAHVVRLGLDGDRVKTGNGTSFDQDAIIYTLMKIRIAMDGGDW